MYNKMERVGEEVDEPISRDYPDIHLKEVRKMAKSFSYGNQLKLGFKQCVFQIQSIGANCCVTVRCFHQC
jgi:hypothetical protein